MIIFTRGYCSSVPYRNWIIVFENGERSRLSGYWIDSNYCVYCFRTIQQAISFVSDGYSIGNCRAMYISSALKKYDFLICD